MTSVKREKTAVVDVILQHLRTYGNSTPNQPTQIENQMSGITSASTSEDISEVESGTRSSDEVDRYKIVFEDMSNKLFVPCVWDTVTNEKLIPVKVANSKVCSVYPNVDQVAEAHSELRKPLCTRSIKSESLLEIFNHVLQFHCANEYGSDYALELMDRFVIFDDFVRYYKSVRKAFPRVSKGWSQRVAGSEVLPVQGGFLKLAKIVCPYVVRSGVALLPMQIVKIALFGTVTHEVYKESIAYLNGWSASPRELAFFTYLCQQHHLPLVFGRDTLLIPLPQLRTLFKDKQGYEIFVFPEKDDASDHQRIIPLTPMSRAKEQPFVTGNSMILQSVSNSLPSISHRSIAHPGPPNPPLVTSVQHFQNSPSSGREISARPPPETPLMTWNLQQMSNLPRAENDSLHKHQKRPRMEKNVTNYYPNLSSCATAV